MQATSLKDTYAQNIRGYPLLVQHVRSALCSSCSVFKLSAPQSWWSPGSWYSSGSLGTDSRGPQVQEAPAGTAWVVTPPCGHLCRCGNWNDTHYPARINHRDADWLTGVEALEFICTSWKALHNYAFNHTKICVNIFLDAQIILTWWCVAQTGSGSLVCCCNCDKSSSRGKLEALPLIFVAKYLSVGSKLMFPDSTHIRLQRNKQVKLNGCFHLQFSVRGACDVE